MCRPTLGECVIWLIRYSGPRRRISPVNLTGTSYPGIGPALPAGISQEAAIKPSNSLARKDPRPLPVTFCKAGEKGRTLVTALVAVAVAVVAFGGLGSAAGAQEVMNPLAADPEGGILDTQQEIEKELAAGRNVTLPDGEVRVADLYIPAGLRVESKNRLGARIILRRMTNKPAVRLGAGSGLRGVRVDGNGRNQGLHAYSRYDGRRTPVPDISPPTVSLEGRRAFADGVRANDCRYDCFEVAGAYGRVVNSEVFKAGRFGYRAAPPAVGSVFRNDYAERTGDAWLYEGGGAGFQITASDSRVMNATTRHTNGDGVAAYGSNLRNVRVTDSRFMNTKNHCVHGGGRNFVMARNYCRFAKNVGYLFANNWRPGQEALRANASGAIRDSIAMDTRIGVRVQWAKKGVRVENLRIYRSRHYNASFIGVRNAYIRGSILRSPGYRTGAGCHIHRRVSRVHAPTTGRRANNLNYRAKTRPSYCYR